MVTVTVLPQNRPLTADDLETMPDDGHRYELIDGTLLVTPAPVTRHQEIVVNLITHLASACSPDLRVLTAPFDVRLADDTVLQPDVLVCRRSDLTESNLPTTPLLAIEVLSPSTRLVDLNLKRARYEQAGCPSYWTVDPDGPSLTVWELRDGAYVEVAAGGGEFATTRPFAVTLVAGRLAD